MKLLGLSEVDRLAPADQPRRRSRRQRSILARAGRLGAALLRVTAVGLGLGLGSPAGVAPTMAQPAAETTIRFPADAGIADVKRDYGAKGDGVTDDTAAIRRALRENNLDSTLGSPFAARTVYFPPGEYLVSDTIFPERQGWTRRDERDRYLCSVRIVGAGEGKTTIRLKANAPGFGNASSPKYVVRTGDNPEAGGQPNSGFANYIQHLTVEVGPGNPGAVGVRFDVANSGAMEHVTVRSTDAARPGQYGLGFYQVGGAGYIHDVTVEGFDWGIYFDKVNVNNYVLERVRLRNQRIGGILNEGKNIQIVDLATENSPVALRAVNADAAVVLVRANLDGKGAGPAIDLQRRGFFHGRDVAATGFANILTQAGTRRFVGAARLSEWGTHGYRSGSAQRDFPDAPTGYVSMRLPIEPSPEHNQDDLGKWANVASFGATRGNAADDDGPAVQRAIDSGAEVIYFPYGSYLIKSDVTVRRNVRKVDFLFSEVEARGGRLVVGQGQPGAVVIENVTGNLRVVHDSAARVAIRNAKLAGSDEMVTVGRNATGHLFVDNMGPHAAIKVSNGVSAWLRQINRERAPLANVGSTVWLLGDNVERMEIQATGKAVMNPIKTTGGGRTEVIGGAADANAVRHPAGLGAYFQSVDSRVSVVIAGVIEGSGGWDSMVSDVRQGRTVGSLGGGALVEIPPAAGRRPRIALPLYVSPR